MASKHLMLCGTCPDEHCQTKLYFPSYDVSIECPNCGQRHLRDSLRSVEEVKNADVAIHSMLRTLLVGNVTPKKTTDSVKVLGLSNYHCKLLSPLLTRYGMDKQGNAVPLRTLNQGDVFNCAILGSRAFLIQPEHIEIMGYGRDQTGSARYLQETLESINRINDNQEVLIPIHADGDGHCLVHGISRALVGRELFWHALRTSLKTHFQEKLDIYQAMFHDFVDSKEWGQIIAESDPDFVPGPNEEMGLQNIHVFGLANVLHRPIILLDSLSGLQSAGDYTGVFLPALVEPESCQGPDGSLNRPLCIAWSSSGRNHFIALVGVKGRPLPKLPRWMLTRVWGAPQNLINKYIKFNDDDSCTVGGDRSLQDKYIQRLSSAMESVFQQEYSVHPSVVADVHHYIYKRTGIVGLRQDAIIAATQRAIADRQLYCCLLCNAVSQILDACTVPVESLKAGGPHYNMARETYTELGVGKIYSFPTDGLQCLYDPILDELVPDLTHTSAVCTCCKGKELRLVRAEGTIVYHNGDKTSTPAPNTKCSCGYKHFWDSKEYDNMPTKISVPLNWKNETFTEDVVWFQNESDLSMNSNAYEVASQLVQKHFPRDFGSETLVKQVVDIILEKTANTATEYSPPSLEDMPSAPKQSSSPATKQRSQSPSSYSGKASSTSISPGASTSRQHSSADSPATKRKDSSPKKKAEGREDDQWNSQQSSKIILSGRSTQSIHKEELTLSNTERELRERITTNAPLTQSKVTGGPSTSHERSHTHTPTTHTAGQKPPSTHPASTGGVTLKKGKHKPASPAGKTQPAGKKIRVTTSDGRQLTLTLESSTTYSQLQGRISQELQLPVDRQKIKYGFPPKELRAPVPEHENDPLPINHGDRITVEIIQDITDFPSTSSGLSSEHSSAAGWSKDSAMQEIKRTIARIQESAGDDLEIQLTSQTLVANLRRMSFWEYVRGAPSMFEKGGLFYKIVERDLGMKDKNHCMLPGLNEHRFCYNMEYDRLELCLEPLGHFPISPDVDKLVELKELAEAQLPSGAIHGHGPGTSMSGHSSSRIGSAPGKAGFPGHAHSLIRDDLQSLVGAIGGVGHGTDSAGDNSGEEDKVEAEIAKSFRAGPGEGCQVGMGRNFDVGRDDLKREGSVPVLVGKDSEDTRVEGVEPMDTREELDSPPAGAELVAMDTDSLPAGGPSGEGGGVNVVDTEGEERDSYVSMKLGPGYTVLVKDNEQNQ